jgi:hypothetical protein
MTNEIAVPAELAKRKQLFLREWELKSLSIVNKQEHPVVDIKTLWIEAAIRPVTEKAMQQIPQIAGAHFFLRGHLFQIISYSLSIDFQWNGGVLEIEAKCIWASPNAEDLFKMASKAATKFNTKSHFISRP